MIGCEDAMDKFVDLVRLTGMVGSANKSDSFSAFLYKLKVCGLSQKDKDIDKNKGKTKKDKEIVHPTDGSISDYRLQSLRLSQQSGSLLSTTRRVYTLKRVELKL